ncbi:MAG: enoyl-CoA hydratase/isomerase family protein [Kofleriaceae bacterium]|nr:enoyl-CoA hydratase/isomerase family protein [Kofleriaceae bacterium]
MNSGYSDILFSEDAGIARITLNRPAKRNAIAQTTLVDISVALNYVKDSSSIRVVVLTGAGSYFCAGGDLSLMSTLLDDGDTLQQRHPLKKSRWPSYSCKCMRWASLSSRWSTARRWQEAWG